MEPKFSCGTSAQCAPLQNLIREHAHRDASICCTPAAGGKPPSPHTMRTSCVQNSKWLVRAAYAPLTVNEAPLHAVCLDTRHCDHQAKQEKCLIPAHMCHMFRQPPVASSPACTGAGSRVLGLWGTLDPAHQMNRVRQASMVQRAAPLRRLVMQEQVPGFCVYGEP